MRPFIIALTFLVTASVNSQEITKPLTKRVIVKTNVLSLIAQRPTVSIEKAFGRTFSFEVSFVKGQFNNFFFTDHYDYNGFLLRAKKHFLLIDYGKVSPYGAAYIGNLKRAIQTQGQALGSGGYIGYPSRNFTGYSVRAGGSLCISYFSKNKILIEGQVSLGYGFYYKQLDKADPSNYSSGYLDTQLWLSIGYCF